MFLTFKKWPALYVLSLVALFLAFTLIQQQGSAVQTFVPAARGREDVVLIIDPGHGGEDGGAVAADGTVESGINLAVALQMEKMAGLMGLNAVMTRSEDISVYDSGAQTLRQKKASDLKNRVALCNETENGVLISIHQNSLPQSPSVHGAQVFYNGQPGSMELAQAIQQALNDTINADTPKSARSIGSGVYLMENTTCPGVLVECGFLSNPDEEAKLLDGEYQKKLCCVITASIGNFLDQ